MNELLLCGWESLDEPGRKCRRPNGHYGAHALATSDSEEALSGVARDLDVLRNALDNAIGTTWDDLNGATVRIGQEAWISLVVAIRAATERPGCEACARGDRRSHGQHVAAAVAVPLAARAALDLLDVIDGIVDDTHPEGDGCPLCGALDELREVLGDAKP